MGNEYYPSKESLENADDSNVAAVSQNKFRCSLWDIFESRLEALEKINSIIINSLSCTLVLGVFQLTFYRLSDIGSIFKSLPVLGIFRRLCCMWGFIYFRRKRIIERFKEIQPWKKVGILRTCRAGILALGE